MVCFSCNYKTLNLLVGPLSLEHLTGLDRETLISALQELGVSFTDDTMYVYKFPLRFPTCFPTSYGPSYHIGPSMT